VIRRLLLAAALVLAAGPALAEPPPPAEAAHFARDPGFVERFLAAALDGPPYYNFMMAPIAADRLIRAADGQALNYFDMDDYSSDLPAALERISTLAGLAPAPDVTDPAYDAALFFAVETRERLEAKPPRGPGIEAPFYTAADPAALPGAVCGVFALAQHPLRPREINAVTVHVLKSAPAAARERCLARVALRALGLSGLGEYADGTLPAEARAGSLLTPEEEMFLWLAYRLPIGADRETLRAKAREILAGL